MEEGKFPTKTAWLLTLAAVAVIGLFWLVVNTSEPKTTRLANYDLNANSPFATAPPVLASDPTLGPADAKFTLIEFGDYACAACADAENELIALLQKRNDTRLVWKDFPLADHPESEPAAEAARCASDQGKYWPYGQYLFANQGALGADLYLKAAAALGLDQNRFSSCLTSQSHAAQVAASAATGEAAQINYLPFLFINGRPYEGNITADELNAALNAIK